MTKLQKVLLSVVGAVALIGLVLGVIDYVPGASNRLGAVYYDVLNQVGDIYQGLGHVLIATGGVLVGNVSSTTVTANTVTVNTGLLVGGTAVNNKLAVQYVATSTFLGSGNSVTIGPLTSGTSSASTTVGITGLPASTFAVGDICLVAANLTSTTAFGADCSITSVATTTASTSITIWNGGGSPYTLPTSSVLHIKIEHAGL